MKTRNGPRSFMSGMLCGMTLITKNTATQEIAQKKAIKPAQMRIVMRAQLRRRKTLMATTSSPMATIRMKSQTTAAAARVSGGRAARLEPDSRFGWAMRNICISTPNKMPTEAKRIATTPAAVTAGRDSRWGSMKAVYHFGNEGKPDYAALCPEDLAAALRKPLR